MRIPEFKEVVKACCEADIPVWAWGERGIGKSDAVYQVSQELEGGFVDLRLATQEVSDLIGMPVKVFKKGFRETNGNGTTQWLKPEWFPEGGNGILFLDEANRAPRDVIQSVFQLVRDRRMHTHKLPPGWRIVAAGNYESTGYDVRRMDEAFMSRFLHVNVEVNHEDLCNYGTLQGWTGKTVEFLRTNTSMIIKPCDDSSFYDPAPDPRRWEMVDRLVRTNRLEGSILMAALTGLVGSAAAKHYVDFAGASVHFRDVLTGKIPVDQLDEKAFRKLSTEVVGVLKDTKFTEKKAGVLSTFVRALPKDLGTMAAKSILSQLTTSEWAKYLRNDPEVLKYFEFLFGSTEK